MTSSPYSHGIPAGATLDVGARDTGGLTAGGGAGLSVLTPVLTPILEGADLANATDEMLMALLKTGNVDAYRLLIRRYFRRLYAVARRILPNDSDAEDVVQDAFLQVWNHRETWQPISAKFTTWIHRIVINRCIDYRRRPAENTLELTEDIMDDSQSFDEIVLEKELATVLRTARQRLPASQQVALALYYDQSMSAAEVAAAMNTTVVAAEALLKRARQRLRSAFRKTAIRPRDAFDDA
ncbi:sigma-70 family RNA polymerase sigma factor [Nitrospirillum sp. BR 11828]|uniref:sigma-70 family RNA polymerase sigma factor n=1 Tax=Nitrospirillum sp. BR 11828 TaxID=3104325 RepID=UPI002ACA7B7D|nr:sigma-70 family RNA polymerase sigma factor [Nitrospirillum sp. BR 11828]MDZ5648792.1 sigma-70 family RNA polymerase sigma factor [Nitrospirillum sp. BR 11828]